MQNKYYSYYPKRSLYYWAKIFTEDIKETNLYKELNKTISINLLNENFPKTEKIHSIYRIYEENEYTLLDDSLEIHYLDMTKLNKKENLNELEKWLLFLQTDKKEVRDMLSSENKTLEKANKVIDMFYSDDIEREMYMTAEKYEMDRYFINLENYEKGVEKGIEKGIEKEKKDIAMNMIKEGLSYSLIEKITGLDENILKKLK